MDWLTLHCTFCATKFKIKLAHAHLKGRCPVCGFRIKAPRPDLYEYKPLPVGTSDEPGGLLAEDEDWPEPAIVVVEEHTGGQYTLSSGSVPAVPVRPDPAGSKDVFSLGAEYQKPIPPSAAVDAIPVEPPIRVAESAEAAAKPLAPPKPPAPVRVKPRAVPLEPIPEEPANAKPQAPPQAAVALPKPQPPPAPADPLFDDILVPAPPRPDPKPKDNPPPAAARGPRFAVPSAEPPADDDVPFADERPSKPLPPPRVESPAKAEPIVGTYLFKDAPEGTAAIQRPVDEFAHVSPSPQVAPLPDLPKQGRPPEAKFAPTNSAPPLEETKAASQEELYQYRLSEAERKPYRSPPPPDQPMWTGVWSFAWQGSSLKMLAWLCVGFTALFAALWFCSILIQALQASEGSGGVAVGIGLVFAILAGIWITLWTGSYASACTLKIVEETASGEPDITGPDGGWKEWFWSFLRLGFVGLCGVMACGLPGLCLPAAAAVVIFAILWPAVFNTFFLSILGGDSFWAIIHGPTIEKMGSKLGVTLKMYLWTLVLTSITLTLGWLTISVSGLFSLVGGVLTAICCLTYARMMGRVGMLLMADEQKARKKRKKKRDKNPRPDIPMPNPPVATGEPE